MTFPGQGHCVKIQPSEIALTGCWLVHADVQSIGPSRWSASDAFASPEIKGPARCDSGGAGQGELTESDGRTGRARLRRPVQPPAP